MTPFTPTAVAQEPAKGVSTDVQAVTPFVSESTFLLIKIDPANIELPKQKQTPELSDQAKQGFERLMKQLDSTLQAARILSDGQPIYATANVPVSEKRMDAYFFRRTTSPESTGDVIRFVDQELRLKAKVHGDYVVGRSASGELPPSSVSPAAFKTITAALQAVESYPIQVVLYPPEHVRRTFEELAPDLPDALGGGSSSVLTQGVHWLAIGVDPEKLQTEIIIQSADDQAAENLAKHLPKMLRTIHAATPMFKERFTPENLQSVIQWLSPKVEGSQVKIEVSGAEKSLANLSLLAAISEALNGKAQRADRVTQFKQLLLAMHNYYDVYRSFPPIDKHRNKDGQHHLSWRVHILPFVEQQALYEQFHLDEPWDSPHNIKLLDKMPPIYAAGSPFGEEPKIAAGHTTFVAPVGEKTIFGGAKAAGFPDIRDGTSNTIAVVEVDHRKAVPWTAPRDYEFDPKDPLAGIQATPEGVWISAFADGSVRFLRVDLPKETVLHLFQMSDGHAVEID